MFNLSLKERKAYIWSVRSSFSARHRRGEFEVEGEVLDQVGSPSAVGASGTPKRFWLWSKYGPSGPSPAPGHTNPRPSHILLLFSWLQNASGYQSRWGVFFSFNIYS